LRPRHIPAFVTAFIVAILAAGLACCSLPLDELDRIVRTGTVREGTLRDMDRLDMDRDAPILIRIYKEESTLEVWKQKRTGAFALLKAYPICKFSGKLGPKIVEGDHQAPEGFYDITPTQMNPFSREYLAFNIGFPNAFDQSLRRTGSALMVHGGCKSIGCYAMTNYGIEEIYGLINEAFNAGQEKVQVQAFPFRMTAQNLAHHKSDENAPFWTMLKVGSDAFLATGRPPAVAVCDRRYVFNPPPDTELDPSAPCPAGVGDDTIMAAGAMPVPIEHKTKANARARMFASHRLAAMCRLKPSPSMCVGPARLRAQASDHPRKTSARAMLHRRHQQS
jgi:murein L,D-transpeptidase YafK